MADQCWFQKDGIAITEGIECVMRFQSAAAAIGAVGLEIYDVLHNGERIAEIYAGTPQNCKEGYSFRIDRDPH